MKIVKRVNTEFVSWEKNLLKKFLIYMRWWMFTKLIVKNHFMVYVNQIIMLYTLNLCSAVCQLYRNKTGRNKQMKRQNICWSLNTSSLVARTLNSVVQQSVRRAQSPMEGAMLLYEVNISHWNTFLLYESIFWWLRAFLKVHFSVKLKVYWCGEDSWKSLGQQGDQTSQS